jgi:hypothetical protein
VFPGNYASFVVNQATHRAAVSHMIAAQAIMQRSRMTTPPIAAITQVVEALIEAPPTVEELHLLTEIADTADEGEAQLLLQGTRLGDLLRVLAENDIRILTYVMALLMIIQLISDRHPPDTSPPPAPKVTVNVTVPADEIAKQIEEELHKLNCGVAPDDTPSNDHP